MPGNEGENSNELVIRLNANDETAWTEFVQRYTNPLLEIVRRSLPSGIRQKIGDDDIVQQVFRDVFVLAAREGLPCANDAGLWPLLRMRAARQILHERRKFLAARRDVRREIPRADSATNGRDDYAEPADPHADQERRVTVHEQFVRFVSSLEWVEQVIVQLRLEHGTLEKVVDVLQRKWSLRKVQGIWEGIRKKAREGRYGWMDGWMDDSLIGSCDVMTNAVPAHRRR